MASIRGRNPGFRKPFVQALISPMPITLSPEITKKLQASIKRYAAENLDQEMGDLKAGLFLDYCLKEIGPAGRGKG